MEFLEEAKERESELKRKANRLEKKYEREKGDVDEQISYIQSLKEEVSLAMEKKRELDHIIHELGCERDNLLHSLDFSVGKITFFERRHRDQENLINSSEREIDELRASNHQLMEKLEAWSVSISSSPSFMTSMNLELELSASDSDLSIYKWYDFILVALITSLCSSATTLTLSMRDKKTTKNMMTQQMSAQVS